MELPGRDSWNQIKQPWVASAGYLKRAGGRLETTLTQTAKVTARALDPARLLGHVTKPLANAWRVTVEPLKPLTDPAVKIVKVGWGHLANGMSAAWVFIQKNPEILMPPFLLLTGCGNPEFIKNDPPPPYKVTPPEVPNKKKDNPPKTMTDPLPPLVISAMILFDFDQFQATAEFNNTLHQVATQINAHPEVQLIIVEGHTDTVGTDAYNQKLSEKRATWVKEALVKEGVKAERLRIVGKGETALLVNRAGRLPSNRRVVFQVVTAPRP